MQWDVFISHASEDKASVGLPLKERLEAANINVWFDAAELSWGDNLSQKIDEGLANSTFGIVILSKHFFAKQWPQRELAGLVQREVTGGRKLILPLLHEIDNDYVARFSPTLASKLSLGTGDLAAVVHAARNLIAPTTLPAPDPSPPPKPTLTAEQWRRVDELSSKAAVIIENRINKPLELVNFGKIPYDIQIPAGGKERVLLSIGEQTLKLCWVAPRLGTKHVPKNWQSNRLDIYLSAQQYFFICSFVPRTPGVWNALKREFQPDFRLELTHVVPWPELVMAGLVRNE